MYIPPSDDNRYDQEVFQNLHQRNQVSGGPDDGEQGGMSVWEGAGDSKRRGIGICGS